jgi:hypothetical protein
MLLLTLFLAHWFFSPRWWRWYIPLKHRFLQESHSINIPENGIPQGHRCGNLKSYICCHCSTHFTNHYRNIRSSPMVKSSLSHCLVAVSNGRHSSSSGLPNCPCLQLPASHSKSSEHLNPTDYLTHHQLTPIANWPSPVTYPAYNILAWTA